MTATSQPPGWYPDPQGRFASRYFDGQAWTATVQDHSGWTGHESQAPAAPPTAPPTMAPAAAPAAAAPATTPPAPAVHEQPTAGPTEATLAGDATGDTTGEGAASAPTDVQEQDDAPAATDTAGAADEVAQTELIPATPAQATPAQPTGPIGAPQQGAASVPPSAPVAPAVPPQPPPPSQPYPQAPPQFPVQGYPQQPVPGYPQQPGYPGGAYPPPANWAPPTPAPYPGGQTPATGAFGPGVGLVVVLLGALGLVLSYFALDWVEGGSFLDIRKLVDALGTEVDNAAVETYYQFVAFVIAGLGIVLAGTVAFGIRSRVVAYLMFGRLGVVFWEKGGRGVQVMPAVFCLAFAGFHIYVLTQTFTDPASLSDAKVGAWFALAGYLLLAIGCAIGPRRIQPNYGGYPGGGYPTPGAPGGYGYPPAGGYPGGYQGGGYQGGGYG